VGWQHPTAFLFGEVIVAASRSGCDGLTRAGPPLLLVPMWGKPSLGTFTRQDQDIHGVAVLAYVFFSLLDCLTTSVALHSGRAYERNPFAASIYASHGIAGLYLIKFMVVAAIIVALMIMPRRMATWIAVGFTALGALAVVSNLHVLLYG
jgi:hypothetical protein